MYGFTQDMIAHAIKLDSGFLEIAAYGWKEKPSLSRALEVDSELLTGISKISDASLSLRIRSGGLLTFKDKTKFVSILASDSEQEKKITRIQNLYIQGGPPSENPEIGNASLGYRLAESMGLVQGSEFYIISSQFDGSMGALRAKVSGIYKTNNSQLDNGRVMVSLTAGHKLFGTQDSENQKEYYTSIALSLEDYLQAEKIKNKFQQTFPEPKNIPELRPEFTDIYEPVALDWKDLNPGMVEMLSVAGIKMDLFMVFFILSISFGILNTVQMSIQERLREFGVLLSIGTRHIEILKLISLEIALLLFPGVFIGIFFASLLGFYLHANPLDLTGTTLGDLYMSMGAVPRYRPIVDMKELFSTLISLTVPSFFIALISVRRIFKINPVEVINII